MSGRNGYRKTARHQHRRPTAGPAKLRIPGLARRAVVHLPIADKPEQRAVFMLPAGLAFAVAPVPHRNGVVVSRVDPDPHSGNKDSFREWQLSEPSPKQMLSSRR